MTLLKILNPPFVKYLKLYTPLPPPPLRQNSWYYRLFILIFLSTCTVAVVLLFKFNVLIKTLRDIKLSYLSQISNSADMLYHYLPQRYHYFYNPPPPPHKGCNKNKGPPLGQGEQCIAPSFYPTPPYGINNERSLNSTKLNSPNDARRPLRRLYSGYLHSALLKVCGSGMRSRQYLFFLVVWKM